MILNLLNSKLVLPLSIITIIGWYDFNTHTNCCIFIVFFAVAVIMAQLNMYSKLSAKFFNVLLLLSPLVYINNFFIFMSFISLFLVLIEAGRTKNLRIFEKYNI